MDRTALHQEVRNALSVADELSRHEHFLGQDDLAGTLSALRSALAELEREVGRSHAFEGAPSPEVVESLERSLGSLTVRRDEFPPAVVTDLARPLRGLGAVRRIELLERRAVGALLWRHYRAVLERGTVLVTTVTDSAGLLVSLDVEPGEATSP